MWYLHLLESTSIDVHFDVVYHPFPINSQYLKTFGVHGPVDLLESIILTE